VEIRNGSDKSWISGSLGALHSLTFWSSDTVASNPLWRGENWTAFTVEEWPARDVRRKQREIERTSEDSRGRVSFIPKSGCGVLISTGDVNDLLMVNTGSVPRGVRNHAVYFVSRVIFPDQ
jgi:hypothetical protein